MLESLPPVWLRPLTANPTETSRGVQPARLVAWQAAADDGGAEQAVVELINSALAWIGSPESRASHAPRSDSRSTVASQSPSPRLRPGSEPLWSPPGVPVSAFGAPEDYAGEGLGWRLQATQLMFAIGEKSRIHTETHESRFGCAGTARRRNASDDFHRSRGPSAAPSW